MSQRSFTIRALGEIALRCIDLESMVTFYRDVIGLEPLNDANNGCIVFLRIAEGFGGHTAVLALFRNDTEGAGQTRAGEVAPATGPGSSLHDIAFSLPGRSRTLSSHGMRRSVGNTTSKLSIGKVGAESSPSTQMATPLNLLPKIRAGPLVQVRRHNR